MNVRVDSFVPSPRSVPLLGRGLLRQITDPTPNPSPWRGGEGTQGTFSLRGTKLRRQSHQPERRMTEKP